MKEELQSFLDRAYSMSMRNVENWIQGRGLCVFDWLNGAFPRGILPTDCDGEVEIKGQFLRIELKNESLLRGGLIPKGQVYLFNALVKSAFRCKFVEKRAKNIADLHPSYVLKRPMANASKGKVRWDSTPCCP